MNAPRSLTNARTVFTNVAAWRPLRPRAVIAGVIALVAVAVSAHLRSTPYNNYVLLADAWRHGAVAIDWPGPNLNDALPWHGKAYVIEAPFPALLLLPFVMIWGTATNQTLLAIALAGIAVAAAWELCERLGASIDVTFWLVVFFLAGTDLWWCSMLGDVWFIAHTAAVTATMLALLELTGKRRGWIVALLAACAFESRFTMVMAIPFYAYILARGGFGDEPEQEEWALKAGRLRAFALAFLPVLVFWVWYNEIRWGTIADIGYTEFYHQDPWGQKTGSPFRLAYFPYELYSFFMRAPLLSEFRQLALPPFFKVDPNGVALTFTSPALIIAFFAPKRALSIALWVTVALLAIPNFFYYLNGWYQFGMRHALDFEPFLFVLMVFALRRFAIAPRWAALLCGYSAIVGVWGVWYWNTFVRQAT